MVPIRQVRHMQAPACFLADHGIERLTLSAKMSEDTLEELEQLASEQEWLTSILVARSVEEALRMAQDGYRASEKSSHMSCLITGSSYLVAEALGLLKAPEV